MSKLVLLEVVVTFAEYYIVLTYKGELDIRLDIREVLNAPRSILRP